MSSKENSTWYRFTCLTFTDIFSKFSQKINFPYFICGNCRSRLIKWAEKWLHQASSMPHKHKSDEIYSVIPTFFSSENLIKYFCYSCSTVTWIIVGAIKILKRKVPFLIVYIFFYCPKLRSLEIKTQWTIKSANRTVQQSILIKKYVSSSDIYFSFFSLLI